MSEKHQCKNEKECKRKRDKYEELQSKFAPLGQQELDAFLKVMQEGEGVVRFDKHFTKRSLERSVSDNDVREVLKYGWVIERNKTIKSTSIVLLGYVGEKYRPLHVVFDIISENLWIAVTAYDPKTHYWKWNSRFDGRVCFCNFEEA